MEAYAKKLNALPNLAIASSSETLVLPSIKESSKLETPSVASSALNSSSSVISAAQIELLSRASTKNIALNYGKAISAFAISRLAVPYIESHLQRERLKLNNFISFIKHAQGGIKGMGSLRSLLVPSKRESDEVRNYKKVFKKAAEAFIKYFSVNWIMHGKMQHKMAYLLFRGKMLRRVRNPELFTYIRKRI